MSRANLEWTIGYADKELVAAYLRSLMVLSWRTGAGVRHVKAVESLQRTLIARGHAPLSVLNIFELEPKQGISDELRKQGRQLLERMTPHYFAQAYIVLGQGFWAAGIRAFLSAFTGLSSRALKTKTFATTEDAMVWVSGLPGQQEWMRTGASLRIRHVEDVILAAHTAPPTAPAMRAFAPTRPQRAAGAGSSKGLWSGCCGRVCVAYWTEQTSTEDVARMHHDLAALASKEGGPVAMVLYVPPGMPVSSAEGRARATVMLGELRRVIDSVAVVTSGSQMWSVVVESMFRDEDGLPTTDAAWKTFDDIEPAMDWLRAHADELGRYVPRSTIIKSTIDALSVEAGAQPGPDDEADPGHHPG